MNLIKNISVIVISSLIVYYFKLCSVLKAGYLYRLLNLPCRKEDTIFNMQSRILFETVLYLVVIIVFFLLFKLVSKYIELDKIILLTLVTSPILFEISTILYDKSCFKPWYHFDILLWYLPMRFVLWIILYFCFKDLIPLLKVRRNLIILGCVFLIFHVLKIYSRYNF